MVAIKWEDLATAVDPFHHHPLNRDNAAPLPLG